MKPTFGERLRNLRHKANLSQPDLAALVGSSESSISRWEDDQYPPNSEHLHRLSRVFKLSMDELYTGVCPSKP